jgi:hypothetical protein
VELTNRINQLEIGGEEKEKGELDEGLEEDEDVCEEKDKSGCE